MKTKLLLAAVAALSLGTAAAEAAPQASVTTLASGPANHSTVLVQARSGRGGWNYHGPGPNYYQQQRPGPNCYSEPHPVYGWICY